MKKILSLAIAALLSVSVFASCAAPQTPEAATETASDAAASAAPMSEEELMNQTAELTLYTYYVDSDKEIVDYAIEQMKEKFPNVTVVPENRTDADGTVLKTRAAVGELPDIFECPSNVLEAFATSGDITPLDDAMEQMKFADYVYPGVLENRANKDGKIYAIAALGNEPFVIFYNKQVFADNGLSEPKNFDEFKNVVQTLKANGVVPMSVFAQEKWPGLQLYDLAVVAENPEGMAQLETGEAKATDPQFLNAANKLSELVSLGLIGNGAFSTNPSQAFEQFKMGNAGMLLNGVWYFGDAKEYGDNVGYFSYNPFADAGKEEEVRYNVSGGKMSPSGYAVSAKSPNKDLATLYMLHFNIERSKAKTILNGAIPGVVGDVEPQEPRFESFQKYADDAENIKSYSKYSWSMDNAEIKTALEDGVEMLLAGSYKPEDFINTLDGQVKAALGE